MTEPCWKCGVRADIGCRHRVAEGEAPKHIATSDGRSRPNQGQGWNAFKRIKQVNSLLGKSGNPTKAEFEAIAKRLFW